MPAALASKPRKAPSADVPASHYGFAPNVLADSATGSLPPLSFRDDERGIYLYNGQCLDFLDELNARYPDGIFDAIFADPPYFLSNGGISCHSGKMVKVDKGGWD